MELSKIEKDVLKSIRSNTYDPKNSIPYEWETVDGVLSVLHEKGLICDRVRIPAAPVRLSEKAISMLEIDPNLNGWTTEDEKWKKQKAWNRATIAIAGLALLLSLTSFLYHILSPACGAEH